MPAPTCRAVGDASRTSRRPESYTSGVIRTGTTTTTPYVEDYLEFDRAVPFREGSFYYESGLQKADGSTNKGRFGRSVRHLADAEYSLILAAGFEAGDDRRKRPGIREGARQDTGLELVDRPIVEWVSRRPFRDRVFATGIKRAYDNTCAMSSLRIINGGGRAEAQAAHIQPVKANGPDSLRNGGGPELHLPLDVRPRAHLDRRRLRVAAEEGGDSEQRAWAGQPGPAATGAGAEDVLAASAVPGFRGTATGDWSF